MSKFIVRFFDVVLSLVGLIILLPFFILISFFILGDSKGNVIFLQSRVGKSNKDFKLWKFRTMRTDSDKDGSITIGMKDSRITKAGYFLRKYKLDELPQLINVLKNEMSIVGPRPELRKYVNLYNENQKKVLDVKPGITDYASIEYSDENELLAASSDPYKTYIEEIMPSKINLNMIYISNQTLGSYFRIIGMTLTKILK